MQKAKYMERQPEVRWQPVNNGMVDVTLCLNEQKVTIEQGQMEDSAKQMMYEYDYHQFRESADKINEETVRASPAKYMSYVPEESGVKFSAAGIEKHKEGGSRG